MKIVHISHLYHPSMGGVQTFFKNISERLVKDYGDDVTVVTANSYFGPERRLFKEIEQREEIINGVKVIRFTYWRWHLKPYNFIFRLFKRYHIKTPDWLRLQANGPFSPAMKKYLINAKADAYCGSPSNFWFMQLPLWMKCNFFYYGSIHFSEKESKDVLLKSQVKAINASTFYLANTHFEIERLVRLGVQREKIFVLGTGVDINQFQNVSKESINDYKRQLGIPVNGEVIGYAGRIELPKNILVLIKAFERIAPEHPNAYLIIAGSQSDYLQVLQDYCSGMPAEISERIKWRIAFKHDEKPLLFHSLDILCLPSPNESFGLVFLEAWSCKKPVIGAAIGAVKDVISDGEDGLLMNVGDEISLAEKLTTLLETPSLRYKMGERGFKKVQDNFTWDIIVSRLRQCYSQGINNN